MSGSLMLSILRRHSNITSQVTKRLQGLKFEAKKCPGIDQAGISRQKSYQASQAPKDELFSPLDPHQLAPKKKYPLAGVQYLPGSDGKGFPQFLEVPRQGLPQAYKIQHADQLSIAEWAQHCRKLLDEELTKYGAVLFRGLPLFNAEDFSLFSNSLGYSPMRYEIGVGNRPVYDEKTLTYYSTAEPKENNIEPHNDMAYTLLHPHKLIFHCDVPPEEGCRGLTPIGSSIEVLNRLDPEVVKKFEEKQIRYIRNLPSQGGKGYFPWQHVFNTDNRKEVEKVLEKLEYNYRWNEDNSLHYYYKMPATIYHPLTGEKVWFNQICATHATYFKWSPLLNGITYEFDHQYPTHAAYGDGTEIEQEVLQHIREIGWKCCIGFQWKKSDTLILDNLKALHGRLSYAGDRRILVYMSSD